MIRPGSPYFMFMRERSGHDELVDTHEAKVNARINDFKRLVRRGKDPNDYVDDVLRDHGLTQWDLSEKDKNKINRKLGEM